MNNYSNTEKSLKRWLKTKVKVTMTTVIGFLIAGTVVMGADTVEKITVDKETVINIKTNTAGVEAITGINANKDDAGKGKDYKTDKSIDITYKGNADKWIAGIFANTGGEVKISGEKINIDLFSENGKTLKGVVARNEGKEEGKAIGGKIILGGEKTKDINIKVHGNEFVSALEAHRRNGNKEDASFIEVNSENLVIDATSDWQGTADDNGAVYAVFAQGSGAKGDKDIAKIVINSENTKITATAGYKGENKYANSFGLVAFSNGGIEVNGNLEVKADTVLATRGYAVTKINADGKHTVKLDGDIEFNYDYGTSQTTVDADVTLNLSNAESYLTGKISVTGEDIPKEKLEVNSMKLGLSNGGTWNVTGDSFVNELALDGGIINVLKTEETGVSTLEQEIKNEYYQGKNDKITTLNIGKLSGNGGTVTVESNINDKKEISVQETNINISEITGDKKSNLEVGFSGINADDLAKNNNVKEAFEELQKQVAIKGDNGADISDKLDETYFAKEGQVTGEITAKDDGNGNLVITQAEESKTVRGLKDLATINYLSWKQEMGSLTQRMGELRDSSAEHGVWARVYGGKVENGSQYDNEYQTYQVGYDKKYSVDNGRVYLGYLVSYTDGETDYDLGHGENYSVGAGIYATWMNNNGHYVDVLYKVSRLNNKFDVASNNTEVGKSHGDYDTYGISLSAEYGKRFDITEKWFAEPSIGMHLGRLGEETYTTDSGIEVSQDSIYTAEGRIGTAVGYKFNDKGNVYARTHVVKEFAGDVDAEYTANGATSNTSEDMGDTWLEFGVGVNYRFAENVNVYADIEKSGDATVDTEWQGNLGFRYEF